MLERPPAGAVNQGRPAVRLEDMVVLRVLAVAALISALLVTGAGTACACTCAEVPPAEAVRSSSSVFTATVEGVRADGPEFVGATLRVDHVYKGDRAAKIEVFTRTNSAACGYTFEPGVRYLLFTRTENGRLTTMLCSGNRRVPDGTRALRAGDDTDGMGPLSHELIAALGDPGPPIAPGPASPPPASGDPDDGTAPPATGAPESEVAPPVSPVSPETPRTPPVATPGLSPRAHQTPTPPEGVPATVIAAAAGTALAVAALLALLKARRSRRRP
ncbi:hypothetical protein [Spongiactinospora sp. TRM90649]|uniref:hypothetical protein n=1 Tax=Spongiactinospora sp. TRM90649 TaxID=3031114 RepID=UPI0023F66225|nr:hypothetical protein [Spongiactinospora sp. TRM90649]MDF5756975.1 hypothetical protein [Spongiactinospora sp. TRM90649]